MNRIVVCFYIALLFASHTCAVFFTWHYLNQPSSHTRTFYVGSLIWSKGKEHFYYNGFDGVYVTIGRLMWLEDAYVSNETYIKSYHIEVGGSFRLDDTWLGVENISTNFITLTWTED